ncbi:MAG: LysE family translocator [Candidatus Latescibacteria bacterium]|nr:LysE family translocator [Candidatus Latescibacterota bacterium]
MSEQILIVVGVTFLAMVSPGPDLVIVLRNTIVGGRRAGLGTSIGVLGGNLIHISYCLVGIGWLISQSILAFTAVKYAGAAYLVYLGIMSLRSGKTHLPAHATQNGYSSRAWFVQGFLSNLLNPKGTLFYLGVFTTVITPETPQSVLPVLILCMMAVSASFWLFFVYTLDRPIIRGCIERFQTTINRVFGALLIALGLRVATMDR